jgi:hypothetical protein
MGQEAQKIIPDSLKIEAQRLLEKYEFYHNSLNDPGEYSAERNFIRLFSNPKIQVIQDFLADSATGMVSIQDYTSSVIDNYPDGVEVNLNYAGMVMGKPRFDRDDRYIVKVTIDQTKRAVFKGRVLSADHPVVFVIAFTWDGERAQDFSIHGIILPPQKSDFLGFTGSSGLSGISNPMLASDQRFRFLPSMTYGVGFQYFHQFDNHWGLSTGIFGAVLNSNLNLDSFDPVGGFSIPFKDVNFTNRFWMLDVPVKVFYRWNLSRKVSLTAGAGISGGIRVFETQEVTAYNEILGYRVKNVISDPDWYLGLNRFYLELVAGADMVYWLKDNIGLSAGISLAHGVTSMDHLVRVDADVTKYLGQSNPLWSNSSVTLPWNAAFNLGFRISINKSQK